MLAFFLLFFSSCAFGSTTLNEEAENSRCQWRYTSDHRSGSHFTTYPTPWSGTIEGMLAVSRASELMEANATASWEGSHLTVNVQADILRGFFTFWITGDVSNQLLRKLHRIPKFSRFLPARVFRLLSGAKISECFALQMEVDKNFLERFLEHQHHIQESGMHEFFQRPKCYVDGVEGRSFGKWCVNAKHYTVMGMDLFPVGYIKFSGYQEWTGPLDPRPQCANVAENARWAAPALQMMMESLPDSDFKSGAQHLIAHMSEAEQQDNGVMNIPTFIGMLVGISLISVIAGFVFGQRSQAHNMDSYERVNE